MSIFTQLWTTITLLITACKQGIAAFDLVYGRGYLHISNDDAVTSYDALAEEYHWDKIDS